MNKIVILSLAVIFLPTLAHAEHFMIDPNKADTLRCEDLGFKNESYTLNGPLQNFVFNTPDGQTHSITFETHEDCHAKVKMVRDAQMDANHPWVKIETAPISFAMVPSPQKDDVGTRQISSERKTK